MEWVAINPADPATYVVIYLIGSPGEGYLVRVELDDAAEEQFNKDAKAAEKRILDCRLAGRNSSKAEEAASLLEARHNAIIKEILDAVGLIDADLDEAPCFGTGREWCRVLGECDAIPTRWYWEGWIPAGGLTLLDAGPWVNEDALLANIVARLGSSINPNDDCPPEFIFLASPRVNRSLRQALAVAGANLDAVKVAGPGVRIHDMHDFANLVREEHVRIAVISPLESYCNRRDADVLLGQLAQLAESHGCTIIVTRSAQAKRPQAHVAAASTLWYGRLPGSTGESLLARLGGIGPAPRPLLGRETAQAGTVCLDWTGEADDDPSSVLAGGRPGRPAAINIRVTQVLTQILAAGPVEASEVKRAIERATGKAISARTLARAKKQLGIESDREKGGPGQPWIWTLPATTETIEAQPRLAVVGQ
jgi:hypothetical protein